MNTKPTLVLAGVEKGVRVDSRLLEERLQRAVREGHRYIQVIANGQHGIGGRLWAAGDDPVTIDILDTAGQRVGAMGFPNTSILVEGPASDDVGWLNAGAEITVRGNATNGVGNAMAQGRISIAGSIGARGMTMTKHNPRFSPPELWVLGGAGDSFAEFMAGGIAVVCGVHPQNAENVLGYRPCVGMVGGRIYFRGPHHGYSEQDARLETLGDEDWEWLTVRMPDFLAAVGRSDLSEDLMEDREAWKMLIALTPQDKRNGRRRNIAAFHREVWDGELGARGLIGDLSDQDRSPIDVIPTGELRRFVPRWENDRYLPPCEASCPTGIPVQKRWELIRKGMHQEAVDLALVYTPFPATVCGYLCPHLCMESCTREASHLPPVDTALLGKASLQAKAPVPAAPSGARIAVIGGGPAGLSTAWQLWLAGHKPVVFETRGELGGKITDMIPRSRIPDDVVARELERIKEHIPHERLRKPMTKKKFLAFKNSFAFIVVATGAGAARTLPVPGNERAIPARVFLQRSRRDEATVGRRVVVIGAGNVGCDAAAEAARLGAESVVLVDIQEPASFGAERQAAEAAGAKFLWPRRTEAITDTEVVLGDGEALPADTVIMAIGDQPDLGFLPEDIATERGFIRVDETGRSSDPRVFAIGDAVKLGLLTDAIGAGRTASRAIDDLVRGRHETYDRLPPIERDRVKLEYYDPRVQSFADADACARQCASCGACRDCHVCETVCPVSAIARTENGDGSFAYAVVAEHCIGCGFCAGACPTGVWRLVESDPLS